MSLVDPENFVQIFRILLFSWFRIRLRILHDFLNNILDINFTILFLPCKCVRLLIRTRNKLFMGIFCGQKGIYIFKSGIFVEKLSNFTSFSK